MQPSPHTERQCPVAEFTSQRPPLDRRRFVSEAVEATIGQVTHSIADPELAWMFGNCFPNTLDTTVRFTTEDGQPDTFVITGDIPAMWLRDSSAQVWPYLPLARDDRKLRELIAGVIRRQARCMLIDPYANAFYDGPGASEWAKDLTDMKPELHERKYEIDSLCYPVRLSYGYWKTTGDAAPFDATWRDAMRLAVKTFREQQRLDGAGPYKFQRVSAVPYDTVYLGGYGNPSRRCGLIHSAFRPSDDACIFPFLIPSNMFAVVAMRALSEMAGDVLYDQAFAGECSAFAHELEGTVRKFAVMTHPGHGPIYAYEVDGFGNALFMDDANVPSLLALPYLGWCSADDPTYRATRGFLLSDDNPYFFRGSAGEGIGGPHVGVNWVWPMAIIVRALTSTDDKEIAQCLRTLKATHAGTGFMHESFHKDDPTQFTRAWFAWANTLFGELILRLQSERPALLARPLI
jgi:uncharacterized protein